MRKLIHGLIKRTSLVFAASCFSGITLAAQPQLAAMQGAWLQGSSPCWDVYTATGKGIAFKKSASAFAPGFIVSGNRLTTPVSTCRIQSLEAHDDRQVMSLNCTGAVSTMDVKILISVSPDGVLYRYVDAEDRVGSKYQRCAPKDLRGGRGDDGKGESRAPESLASV
jgi:hypothetical protein